MKFIRALKNLNLPPYLSNRYVLTVFVFLLWMLFFDQNNLLLQWERNSNLRQAKKKKAYYEKSIREINTQMNELLTNEETLERFGREKYYMKKEDEELFILLPED